MKKQNNSRLSKGLMFSLLKEMLKIRLAEESIVEPIIDRTVKCPCHLYSGQEAIAAGICGALNKSDYVFGNHRSHGHYLAKGGSLQKMIDEVYCKSSGCSGGRGGSMHLIDTEVGMLGSAPIVGGTISLATGAALAAKIRKDGRVSVAFFGDGSTGEGALYESLNFAALKKLPIIYVCENNLYSTHMSINECRPSRPVFEIAAPFGIDGFQVDGNDVLKVYEKASYAVDKCRKGEGPVFIECLTYRLRGHVGPDDNIQGSHTDIRPKQEIEEWKKRDPIDRFEKYLISNGYATNDFLNGLRKEISEVVRTSHEIAVRTPDPQAKELLEHVFK